MRKRSKRGFLRTIFYIIFGLVVLLGVLLAVGLVVLDNIDPNLYKERVTAEISREIDREVVIDGDLHLDISTRPEFGAQDVRIGNVEWGSSSNMLRVGEFRVKVSLLSFLRSRFVVDYFVLRDAEFNIEIRDGKSNIGGDDYHAGGSRQFSGGGSDGFDFDEIPIILSAQVENVSVSFTDHDKDIKHYSYIEAINIGSDSLDKSFNGSIRASIDGGSGGSSRAANLMGDMTLQRGNEFAAELRLDSFESEIIADILDLSGVISGRIDGQMSLQSQGESWASIVDNLAGYVEISSDKINLHPPFEVPVLTEILTDSGCLLIEFPISEGKADIDSAIMLTRRGLVRSIGEIDFAGETLSLANDIKVGDISGTLDLRTRLDISGSLSSPEFSTASDGTSLNIDAEGLVGLLTGESVVNIIGDDIDTQSCRDFLAKR